MQPLNPALVKKALARGATADEIAEYQELLAGRFARDPAAPKAAAEAARATRIRALATKIFGHAGAPAAANSHIRSARHPRATSYLKNPNAPRR